MPTACRLHAADLVLGLHQDEAEVPLKRRDLPVTAVNHRHQNLTPNMTGTLSTTQPLRSVRIFDL
jgi:hypothetical protein